MSTPPSTRDADVVVVGAGLGGLVVAAYAAAAGRRVVVVDRHSVVGGNASVFAHHGYEFDVGVHYVGDCEPGGGIPSVLEPLGIRLSWRELDPDGFDTYVLPDGTVFRVPKGVDAFRDRLAAACPDERAAIDAFFDAVVEVDAGLRGRGAPDALMRYAMSTLAEVFDELHASPRLRLLLGGQHAIYALPPSRTSFVFHAAVVMHYARGAFYPEGGGQVIADALAASIQANGGEILLQTPVDRILVEGGRARGVRLQPPTPLRERGVPEEILAPVVVSNADLKRTWLELVEPEHLPAGFLDTVRGYRMALPLFVLYLILDRDLRAEGWPNSNLFVLPGDDVESLYAHLDADRMPADSPVFMSLASLKDPTNPRLCRPGQTNLQLMSLSPGTHRFWGRETSSGVASGYRRDPKYLERKRELRDVMVPLAERAVPGLGEAIVYQESATAMTHERFVRSTGGTSYGIEASPDQFLFNRPAPGTPIEGLFVVGASTIGGHGIAGVMSGGLMAAGAVLGAPVGDLLASGSV